MYYAKKNDKLKEKKVTTHELGLNLALLSSSPILSPYSLFVSYTGKLRQVSRTNRTFCKLRGVKSLFECTHRLKDFFGKIANSPQLPTVLFSLTFFATTRQTLPERIYNPITTMGFLAMFIFQLDNTKR